MGREKSGGGRGPTVLAVALQSEVQIGSNVQAWVRARVPDRHSRSEALQLDSDRQCAARVLLRCVQQSSTSLLLSQ